MCVITSSHVIPLADTSHPLAYSASLSGPHFEPLLSSFAVCSSLPLSLCISLLFCFTLFVAVLLVRLSTASRLRCSSANTHTHTHTTLLLTALPLPLPLPPSLCLPDNSNPERCPRDVLPVSRWLALCGSPAQVFLISVSHHNAGTAQYKLHTAAASHARQRKCGATAICECDGAAPSLRARQFEFLAP